MSSAQGRLQRPFAYKRDSFGVTSLHCDEVSLQETAQRYGTPLYVYSSRGILDRLSAFKHFFRNIPHTICYSVKANSNLSILRLLAQQGCGFDVVSGGELARVRRADRAAGRRVVFSGVGKTEPEIRAALSAGILLFNLESASELRLLADCAAKLKKTANIAFRVNPDVSAETHPYISTGLREHKFGVPIGQAISLYDEAAKSKYLKVSGVSLHIGSQIKDAKPFVAAIERVTDLIHELRHAGHEIKFVDAGGGLGISYENGGNHDSRRAIKDYAQAILQPLRGSNLHLLLEPGRSIVGAAGVLLTRVICKKTNGSKRFVIVDAGMNDLIRPSLYQAHHEIVPVITKKKFISQKVDVVGPVCETGDFFARDREMPEVQEGDLVAILDAGAYGMSLASNYNTRGRAPEILITNKSVKVIRRRETFKDLIRNEI